MLTKNFEIFERARCTSDEKKECLELIENLLLLNEKVRREGLLSLDDEIQNISNSFMRMLLRLVVDGTDREIIEEIAETSICYSLQSGVELLKMLIILEGVLSIHEGDNPRITLIKLMAYIQNSEEWFEKWFSEICKRLDEGSFFDTNSITIPESEHNDTTSIVEEENFNNEYRENINREKVRKMNVKELIEAFQNLPSDQLAIILMYIEEEKRLQFLETFSLSKQREIIKNLILLPNVKQAEFIQNIKIALNKILNNWTDQPLGGETEVIKLFQKKNFRDRLVFFNELKQADAKLAAIFEKHLFSFNDINRIDDRSVQELLRKINLTTLEIALKGASDNLKNKILRNIPKSAVSALKKDIKFESYVHHASIEHVLTAQQEIAETLRRLFEYGGICELDDRGMYIE